MQLKDYYQVLEIKPTATIQEIRKAYRRLAHQYHPDKTNNDKYAAAQFATIKEAYEVLTNPSKKYFYLQQRWYEQSRGNRAKYEAVTPESVLRQALELERYTSRLDVFRMDKTGLRDNILELLSDETIEKLVGFNAKEVNASIITAILKSAHLLPPDLTQEIIQQLVRLAGDEQQQVVQIKNIQSILLRKHRTEKYGVVWGIVITLLICLLIWLAGK